MPQLQAPHTTAADLSPPPLPNEPPPDPDNEAEPVDQPILSLGDDEDEEDSDDKEDNDDNDSEQEEEGDEQEGKGSPDASTARQDAAEALTKSLKGKSKGKGKAKQDAAGDKQQPWQAVWSAEQNAWYFWNSITGEVTWTNPLEPQASSSTPAQPPLPPGPPPESSASGVTFGLPRDIDPDLAYLLPPSQRGGPGGDTGGQTALFNSRTGRFTPADYTYTVDHLDEYNRSKRMNSHYFDVEGWEKQRAAENAKRKRDEEAGIAPKKITKKDMDRFRKKAQEKKHRSQAWLRD